jgi:hypothetical protein
VQRIVTPRTKYSEMSDPLASAELLLGKEVDVGASTLAGPHVNNRYSPAGGHR